MEVPWRNPMKNASKRESLGALGARSGRIGPVAESLDTRHFNGDQMRLRQNQLNQADNALNFTDQGTIAVRARLLENDPDGVLSRWDLVETGIRSCRVDGPSRRGRPAGAGTGPPKPVHPDPDGYADAESQWR